ncbi:MAG: hypothetical protein WD097_02045 [Balneolales bacterium]
MSDNLDKIPVPLSQRWREIRVKLFPLLVFVLVAGVVAWLWKDRVDTANMVGKVVGKQAEVRSPRSGSLADIVVRAFDTVSAGDPIGRLITTDPKIVEAELAVVLAEIELLRLSMAPFADQQRNLMDYESMQIEFMENRARLGMARIRLLQSEREYDRIKRIYEDGLTSVEAYEQVETDYLELEEEVKIVEELVERLQNRLEAVDLSEMIKLWQETNPRAAAIEVHQRTLDKIKAEMMPIVLEAPMSGQIASVQKMSGEFVNEGEVVFQIYSSQPDYIIAHLPHPVMFEPEPGMEVLVRKQNRSGEEAIMQITEVGVQLEAIADTSEPVSLFPNQLFGATGLPLRIRINPVLDLRPGEMVDMRLLAR